MFSAVVKRASGDSGAREAIQGIEFPERRCAPLRVWVRGIRSVGDVAESK
jgi:hypothetical protein